MSRKLVIDYKAAWQLRNNNNGIKIKTENSREYELVKINKASEFVAVLTMLQGSKPVYYNEESTIFEV